MKQSQLCVIARSAVTWQSQLCVIASAAWQSHIRKYIFSYEIAMLRSQ